MALILLFMGFVEVLESDEGHFVSRKLPTAERLARVGRENVMGVATAGGLGISRVINFNQSRIPKGPSVCHAAPRVLVATISCTFRICKPLKPILRLYTVYDLVLKPQVNAIARRQVLAPHWHLNIAGNSGDVAKKCI